jgi:predicted  nucleic acid-binding Zn-ribbon protein
MWYVRLSTGGSVDAKFIGVTSIEKPSAVGIVGKMCVKCRIWLKNTKISEVLQGPILTFCA